MAKRYALILIAVFFAQTCSLSAATVRLKSQADVANEVVRLSDVADIADVSGAETMLLENLVVSGAPEPGQSLTLTRRQVQQRMIAGGVNMSEVVLVGTCRVEVKRSHENTETAKSQTVQATQAIRTARLAECIQQYTSRRIKAGDFTVQTSIIGTEISEESLPGEAHLRIVSVDGKVRPGRLSFLVSAVVSGREVKRFKATADVELVGEAVVAVRELRVGMRVEREMVAMRTVRPTVDATELITDISDVVGRRLVGRVSRGVAFKRSDLDSRIVIKSGDTVVVTLRGRGYRIEMKARARRRGAPGDRIEFVNPANGKRFCAVVVGSGQAEMVYRKDGK